MPKIKNPILRWFAGLIVLAGILAAVGGVLIGIGKFTLSLCVRLNMLGSNTGGATDLFLAGFLTLLSLVLFLLIGAFLVVAAGILSDRLFKESELS